MHDKHIHFTQTHKPINAEARFCLCTNKNPTVSNTIFSKKLPDVVALKSTM